MPESRGMSDEYRSFLNARGPAPKPTDQSLFPTTSEEISRSQKLVDYLKIGLSFPELRDFWDNISAAAWQLKRRGMLSEDQLMMVIRKYEELIEGTTRDDWYKNLPTSVKGGGV